MAEDLYLCSQDDINSILAAQEIDLEIKRLRQTVIIEEDKTSSLEAAVEDACKQQEVLTKKIKEISSSLTAVEDDAEDKEKYLKSKRTELKSLLNSSSQHETTLSEVKSLEGAMKQYHTNQQTLVEMRETSEAELIDITKTSEAATTELAEHLQTLEQLRQETSVTTTELEDGREELLENIDRTLYRFYKARLPRILTSDIVRVTTQSVCSTCCMEFPTQLFNRILARPCVVLCWSCSTMIVLDPAIRHK